MKNYLIIALVAFATSATVFELASRDLDNRKVVRIIDLPQATPEALAQCGIDPATIAEYEAVSVSAKMAALPLVTIHQALSTPQEVKPATSGTEPPAAGSSHQNKKPRGLARGTRLTKSQLADEVRRAIPGLPKAEVDAAVWIMWRESGGNPNARNPRSSSHGLNGFISRTWSSMTRNHGIAHSLEPGAQILALQHYAIPRYGSFVAAKRHHERKRWY